MTAHIWLESDSDVTNGTYLHAIYTTPQVCPN
jgi:hypothetical protein